MTMTTNDRLEQIDNKLKSIEELVKHNRELTVSEFAQVHEEMAQHTDLTSFVKKINEWWTPKRVTAIVGFIVIITSLDPEIAQGIIDLFNNLR